MNAFNDGLVPCYFVSRVNNDCAFLLCQERRGHTHFYEHYFDSVLRINDSRYLLVNTLAFAPPPTGIRQELVSMTGCRHSSRPVVNSFCFC